MSYSDRKRTGHPRIGANIRGIRKGANMTQREVEEETGVSNEVICQWESGLTMPTLLNAKRFCDCFGVSLDKLVEGVE